EGHQGVLVSAPTSSGKTVIADYAVFRAIETDTRAIYTTPLKALSNQKYRDYVRLHGEGWVGLVTGENTINPAAPVVVMTTESLRKRPVDLRLWLALRNEFYPLLDPAGGIPRDTRAKAQAESAVDYRLAQMRRPPENDLLPVVERLRAREFLPSIYFIFSRRGCREALARCAGHGLDLTTAAEKEVIDRIVTERLAQVEDRDEVELYRQLLDADLLRRGL